MIGIILGAIVYFVNGSRSFLNGFLISYGLWLIVDWYDAIVIDILWLCHSKVWILPGTEDLPFVQTWAQVLKKRAFLAVIWIAGAAIIAGIVVLLAMLR